MVQTQLIIYIMQPLSSSPSRTVVSLAPYLLLVVATCEPLVPADCELLIFIACLFDRFFHVFVGYWLHALTAYLLLIALSVLKLFLAVD